MIPINCVKKVFFFTLVNFYIDNYLFIRSSFLVFLEICLWTPQCNKKKKKNVQNGKCQYENSKLEYNFIHLFRAKHHLNSKVVHTFESITHFKVCMVSQLKIHDMMEGFVQQECTKATLEALYK